MSHSVALRPHPAADNPPEASTCHAAGFQWRCLPDYRTLIESDRYEWLTLREGPGTVRVKRNGHRDVWRIDLSAEAIFVKRYRSESPAERIKAIFRGPTAALEWDVGHYAARCGIDAVLPVACGWRGSRLSAGPSLLITRGVPGAVPLCDYWLARRNDPHRARSICQSTARLVARAHQCGFHHLDMHAGNIIVQTEQTPSHRPIFVDLHNVRIAQSVTSRAVIANLAQLNQWFRRHATRTQRLRFLREYLIARDEFAQASPTASHAPDAGRLIAHITQSGGPRRLDAVLTHRSAPTQSGCRLIILKPDGFGCDHRRGSPPHRSGRGGGSKSNGKSTHTFTSQTIFYFLRAKNAD